ncbi:peptidylprolyl isomerase [Winogradskyella sp. 3972H.M.0a.05]|uniref:peptidylprolyl isomerase n=1 Tax=Winogradskyella sp. 3972H.M.0a.05 TaxID=2950277 RepID=UPI0033967A80
MTLKTLFLSIGLGISTLVSAQVNNDDVLFTVAGDPITADEFVRVYNKNLDLVKDEKQKDVDEYLKLFVNYQLKLKEAKRLELDKNSKYIREFNNYKKQLTKNYMSESKVTDALVKEAYDRISYDVKATHILIRLDESSKDTIKVYKDIMRLRDRALKEGFETVRKDVHDGNTIFGEDLGYFSGFKMVYDFENVAYNTPVGEVSMPFRTQFGYHIVNILDKRPSRGQVTVAHIMVALNQKDSTVNAEQRIKEINKKLKQGEPFESLAKQFSDDKSSSNKGGRLNPFKSGQLSSVEFENKAFSLQNKDEITAPFKTQYGWHIIKLIDKKSLQPFEELKAELQNRVKRDSRSKLINTALAKELKSKFEINQPKEGLVYFESIIDDNYFKKSLNLPEDFKKDVTLFSINDQQFTNNDFASHLRKVQRRYFNKTVDIKFVIQKEYDAFFENSILKYQENNLELTNQEFADVLKEYRDGLLLFDLMEKEIWNSASKDTTGLKAYYEDHKANYKWDDRVEVVIATSAKRDDIKAVESMMKASKSTEDIHKALNSGEEQKVIFTKGVKSVDDVSLPKDLDVKTGISKIYNYNDAFHVIDVKKVLPESFKTFEEARGRVIGDYQNKIEADWIDELHGRFKVKIDNTILEKVKQQIAN